MEKDYGIWLSSFNHVWYGLFTSKQQVRRFCRKHKLDFPGFVGEGAQATTWSLKHRNGDAVALVCMHNLGAVTTEVAGLVVHEAAHVWQFIREEMGEEKPSGEFEAYSLQKIVVRLLMDYNEKAGQ